MTVDLLCKCHPSRLEEKKERTYDLMNRIRKQETADRTEKARREQMARNKVRTLNQTPSPT